MNTNSLLNTYIVLNVCTLRSIKREERSFYNFLKKFSISPGQVLDYVATLLLICQSDGGRGEYLPPSIKAKPLEARAETSNFNKW